MVVFLLMGAFVLFIMALEGQILKLKSIIFKSETSEMIEAPDLYEEINFEQRCKEFKLQKV